MFAVDAGKHSFTIPVMGIAFTVDSPLKLARYGISSTVSLVDDLFLEQMRKHHCAECGDDYVAIKKNAPNGRALRITAYLDFLDRQVAKQMRLIRALPFDEGSDICRYFELLPPSPLRSEYESMLACDDASEKKRVQESLRSQIKAGAINANIMTKLDRDRDRKGVPLPLGDSDALAAARGFAKSTVDGSLILSAGMNPRLFAYMASLEEFLPSETGYIKKRLVLKVSDFRSADVQSKVLAKKGVWVSEYRIESGLNCGGHAFATAGLLMGPILQEFKDNRAALAEKIIVIFNKARAKAELPTFETPLTTHLTFQGGLGTASEQSLLLDYYNVDSTAWGSPFLLVPEASNLDEKTRSDLAGCRDEDIQLSPSSPLGVPFWNFMNSGSENARRKRIASGKPGSPCPKGHVALKWDFQDIPLCRASRTYQSRELKILDESEATTEERASKRLSITNPSCICHDLSGCATLGAGIDTKATPAICPGPNVVNFKKVISLDEMIGHIYGRCIAMHRPERSHVFLRELELYIEELGKQIAAEAPRLLKYETNLRAGITYYREMAAAEFAGEAADFIAKLDALEATVPSVEAAARPADVVPVPVG
ncbi:MAG: hypothetical protein GY811_24455 [Myxococcales bacterium]|nr:hypothetical protein [Myxococcales bacterium]